MVGHHHLRIHFELEVQPFFKNVGLWTAISLVRVYHYPKGTTHFFEMVVDFQGLYIATLNKVEKLVTQNTENTDRKHTDRKHTERKHRGRKHREKTQRENTDKKHTENTEKIYRSCLGHLETQVYPEVHLPNIGKVESKFDLPTDVCFVLFHFP